MDPRSVRVRNRWRISREVTIAAAATHQSAITEATKRRTGTATLPELLPQKRHHLQVVRQPQRPGHNGRPVSSNEIYLFTSLYSSRRFNNEIYSKFIQTMKKRASCLSLTYFNYHLFHWSIKLTLEIYKMRNDREMLINFEIMWKKR